MDSLLLLIAAFVTVMLIAAGYYAVRRHKAREESPEDLYPLF